MGAVNALFVGGPNDGKFLALPDPAPTVFYYQVYGERGERPREKRYRKRTYPTTRGEVVIYVCEDIQSGLTEERIILALLEVLAQN